MDGEPTADPRVAALLRADPAGFTAGRGALARELSGSGDAALAARVAKLRRPTLATVVLNRLAVDDPDELGRLLAAGARLRAGGDAVVLRKAGEAQRAALSALLAAAEQIAIDLGHAASAALLGKVERGLRAAAAGEEAVRRRLAAGLLEREPEPGEIDVVAGLAALAPVREKGGQTSTRTATATATPTRTATPAPAPAMRARRGDEARRAEERRRAEQEIQRALREVESAEKALAEARAKLAAARRGRARR